MTSLIDGSRNFLKFNNDELYNKYQNLPVLNIGRLNGVTDYLDFFTLKQVTHPIMKGTDVFGRKFIVIKCVINNKIFMQTFFQRYSDNTNHWMGCGHATSLIIDTSGGMEEIQFKLIADLIMEKRTILEKKHRPDYYMGFTPITIYPYREFIAINKIKKQWKLSRWNPKYKMCQTIQYKNFLNIQ